MPKRYEYNLADLFGYALGDVDSGAEAAYAQVGRVWVDGHPALTAQTVRKSKEKLIYENSKLSWPNPCICNHFYSPIYIFHLKFWLEMERKILPYGMEQIIALV